MFLTLHRNVTAQKHRAALFMVGRASCLPNAKAYMPPLCKSQQILNRQARCLSYHFVSLSSEKDNNRIMHLGGPLEFPVLFEQLQGIDIATLQHSQFTAGLSRFGFAGTPSRS
jgi:hypothetical protein